LDARLVVLSPENPFAKDPANKASAKAAEILAQRGSGPRLFQNSLAFLAVDLTRLQDLDEAVRRQLAWKTILDEKVERNLDPLQVRQAEAQLRSVDASVTARLPEAYQWLLVPTQPKPGDAIKWETYRLTGQEGLAARASKKLRSEELLFPSMVGTRLRMELDKIPLWRGEHVAIRQIAEDFARYLYLPRLRDTQVLSAAIQDGLSLLSWKQETFAYADGFDEAAHRYRGLRAGKQVSSFVGELDGLLVRSTTAQSQIDAEEQAEGSTTNSNRTGSKKDASGDDGAIGAGAVEKSKKPALTRYFGSVALDPARVGRDAGRIADEVIAHLTGLVGSEVTVTLEIEARVPSGAPEHVVRTVTENSRTLKFRVHGFEEA